MFTYVFVSDLVALETSLSRTGQKGCQLSVILVRCLCTLVDAKQQRMLCCMKLGHLRERQCIV